MRLEYIMRDVRLRDGSPVPAELVKGRVWGSDSSGDRISFESEVLGMDSAGRRLLVAAAAGKLLGIIDLQRRPVWIPLADVLPVRHGARAVFSPDGSVVTLLRSHPGEAGTNLDKTDDEERRTLTVWDSSDGKIVSRTRPTGGLIWTAGFDRTGSRVAIGTGEPDIGQVGDSPPTLVVRATRGDALFTFGAPDHGGVLDVHFAQDDALLYFLSGGMVNVSDAQAGTVRSKFAVRGAPLCLAVSPSGDEIAVGCDGGRILVLDSASGAEKRVLLGHSYTVHKVMFRPDGGAIFSVGGGGPRLWEVAREPSNYSVECEFQPDVVEWCAGDPRHLIAFSGSWRRVAILEAGPAKVQKVFVQRAVGFATANGRVALALDSGNVEVRDVKGTLLTNWEGRKSNEKGNTVSALCLNADATLIALGYGDGEVHVRRTNDGTLLAGISGRGAIAKYLCFTPDSRLLLTAHSNLRWRDETHLDRAAAPVVIATRLADREHLWQWQGGHSDVAGLATANDGRAYVSLQDGHVLAFRLADGGVERKVRAHFLGRFSGPDHGRSIAIHPDGRRIASINMDDSRLRMLRLGDLEEMLSLPLQEGYGPHIAWSPDGNKLAVGSYPISVFELGPAARRIKVEHDRSELMRILDALPDFFSPN